MELRRCTIKYKVQKDKKEYETVSQDGCLFHRWCEKSEVIPPSIMVGGHTGGELKATFAIIEYPDGTVHEHYPYEVQFMDAPVEFVTQSLLKFVKEVYQQGVIDAKNNDVAFEDGFESDVVSRISDILSGV